MVPRIAIYTRLSHDATGEQTATARQERASRAFAEVRGWNVAEVFEDVDLSAYKRGVVRPQYESLLKSIEAGTIDGALVWKLDRLVRRPAEFERFWSVCETAGAFIASATEPIDTTHDLGVALVRILVTFAHLESATISLRTKARHRDLAEAGKAPSGPAPFGWRKGMLELEPTEAALIREAAARLLDGESLTQISTDWYQRGLRSRAGSPLGTNTIALWVTSPRVVGDRAYHGAVVAHDCFPPILDRETHAALRAAIAGASAGRRTRSTYFLTGLLRCGRCGARMFGRTCADAGTYTCGAPLRHGCNSVSVRQAPLEEFVLTELVNLVRTGPLRMPAPIPADQIAGVLEEYAAALRTLKGRRGLTSGERGALQADIVGDLQRRTGLVLLDGRQVLQSGWHDAKALEANWPSMSRDERRAVLATYFQYIVIHPAARQGQRFQDSRVRMVRWSRDGRAGDQLRRITSGWAPLKPRRPTKSLRTKYRQRWSDDELLAALRAWAETSDHRSSHVYAQDQRVNVELPALATICKRFGGWQHALTRAGQAAQPRVFPHYTDADILDGLRAWLAAGGDRRSATYSQVATDNGWTCFGTVVRRFGSWRAALEAIDEEPPGRRWTHNEVVDAVRDWLAHNRHRATAVAYSRAATGNPELPCLATVVAKLGSWPNALDLTRPRAQRSVGVGSG